MTTRDTGRTSEAAGGGQDNFLSTGSRWVGNGSDHQRALPDAVAVRAAPPDDRPPSVGADGESLPLPLRELRYADRHCRFHVAIIVVLLVAGIALVAVLLRGPAGGQAGWIYDGPAIAAGRSAARQVLSVASLPGSGGEAGR
jgi:hypothetical protein